MNSFNIGQRVWCVYFSQIGFSIRKCLVIGIKACLRDVGDYGVVEKSVQKIDYNLYPISSDANSGNEYLWDGEDPIISSPKRMFFQKDDAFSFLYDSIMVLKTELKDET
jgi:hypothetical protein